MSRAPTPAGDQRGSVEPVFRGVGVALVTVFDDTGAVEAPATADLAARLVDLGVTTIVVAGTTGEAAALERTERIALLTAVRRRLPSTTVLAGTGAASAHQAVTFTRDAVDAGADAVLALSPPRSTDVRSYYDRVAASSAGQPVLAYHYPTASPPGIPVDQLSGLPVAGLKDSSGDPDRLLAEVVGWDRPVFTGSSAFLPWAARLGCPGAILGAANAAPERCVAAFAGDVDAQRDLLAVNQAMANFPRGLKALVAERFGTSPTCRMG